MVNEKEIRFILPYPKKISVNSVWKFSKNGIRLNPAVREFRSEVWIKLLRFPKFGKDRVRVEINMYPPDNRKRDIDNILKATLDALQYSGIFDDDNQIKQLYIEMLSPKKGGELEVLIKKIDTESAPLLKC